MKRILGIFVLFFTFSPLFAYDDDEDEKLKLAVMEFEDKTGRIQPNTLDAATEYLRSVFMSSGKYVVISKGRQKEKVSEIRKEYNTNSTYKSCNDRTCQIQLGQALSADLIVQTTITSFAEVYTISSELTDIEKEATEIGARADYDGTEIGMKAALESIVAQIIEIQQKEADKKAARLAAEKQRKQEEELRAREEKRREEEEKRRLEAEKRKQEEEQRQAEKAEKLALEKQKEKENKIAKIKRSINALKYTGTAFIIAGAAVIGGGIAGFTIDYKNERDKYDKMLTPESIRDAINKGMTKSEYIKSANKHRNNANKSRNLAFACGAVGAALTGMGIALVVVGVEKEEKYEHLLLKDISVIPSSDGFYASLNFNF